MIVLITKINQFIEVNQREYEEVVQAIDDGEEYVTLGGRLFNIKSASIAYGEQEARQTIGKCLGWWQCTKYYNWHSGGRSCQCMSKIEADPLVSVGLIEPPKKIAPKPKPEWKPPTDEMRAKTLKEVRRMRKEFQERLKAKMDNKELDT